MTTPPVEPPANQPPPDDKVTAGTLREWIKEEIKGVVASIKPGTDAPPKVDGPPAVDIKSQVQEALTSLQKREARDRRDAEIDEFLKSAKTTPPTTPKEARRVEKFMKWGD